MDPGCPGARRSVLDGLEGLLQPLVLTRQALAVCSSLVFPGVICEQRVS